MTLITSVVFLTLILSLLFPTIALADGETPPPPTEVPVVEVAPTEEPIVDLAPTEEPVVDAAPTESVAEAVQAMAEAGAVLVDENGQPIPLASQAAADMLTALDPYIVRAGVTHRFLTDCTGQPVDGTNTCTESATPIQAAIDFAIAGETINVEAGTYTEDVTIAKQVTLLGLGAGAYTTSFTLNSGADVSGSDNIFASIVNVNAGASIQDGITLIDNGGTVNVAEGTYRENVVLNKSVTVTGDPGDAAAGPGPNAPILDGDLNNDGTPDKGDGFTIPKNTNLSGITVEGFIIQNFGNGSPSGGNGVGVGVISWENTSSNVTIRDNLFTNLGYNGVYVGTDSDDMQSNWIVQRNQVVGAPYAGIELTDVINSQVLDNEITGPTAIFDDPGDAGVGIEIAARARNGLVTTSNVLVKGNTITGAFANDSRAAINILSRAYNSDSTAVLSAITVEGNVVSDSGTRGIYVVAESRNGGPSQIENLAITQNALTGNAVGIEIGGIFVSPKANGIYDVATITIQNNKLEGNTTFGLDNLTSVTINASGNWWGAASGPSGEGSGTGDSVSANVDYTPWLNSGTDTAPGTAGFQGDFSVLNVDDDSPQADTIGRIQEAVDLVTGSTVNMMAGAYTEDVNINGKDGFTLQGAGSADTIITGSVAANSNTGTLTLRDFAVTGSTWNGVDVNHNGPIVLMNLDSSGNGDSGAWLNNCLQDGTGACTNTDDVSVTNSVFNGNQHHGLDVATSGNILLTNITADNNGLAGDYGSGLSVCNYFDPDGAGPEDGYCQNTAASVTINGTTNVFNNNQYNGFEIYAAGPISLTNITANNNGQSANDPTCDPNTEWCSGSGAYLNTLGPVTVDPSTFNGNNSTGLALDVGGQITLTDITASFNGDNGVDNCNWDGSDCLGSASVTINGTANVFNNNGGWTGLALWSVGAVTLGGVTADANNYGAWLDAGGAVTVSDSQFSNNTGGGFGAESPTGPVTLNNVVAAGNSDDGIDIFTDGNVTLNSATITGNGYDGVYVVGYDNSTWPPNDWAGTVIINGGTFTGNGDGTYPEAYGLDIYACQLSTDGAQTFGGNQTANVFFGQNPACVPAPSGDGDPKPIVPPLAPAAITAETVPLTLAELPGALPEDKTFVAGISVITVGSGQVSFDIPADAVPPFTILFWDGTQWVEIPSTVVDGQVVFTVTQPGVYVLVAG